MIEFVKVFRFHAKALRILVSRFHIFPVSTVPGCQLPGHGPSVSADYSSVRVHHRYVSQCLAAIVPAHFLRIELRLLFVFIVTVIDGVPLFVQRCTLVRLVSVERVVARYKAHRRNGNIASFDFFSVGERYRASSTLHLGSVHKPCDCLVHRFRAGLPCRLRLLHALCNPAGSHGLPDFVRLVKLCLCKSHGFLVCLV